MKNKFKICMLVLCQVTSIAAPLKSSLIDSHKDCEFSLNQNILENKSSINKYDIVNVSRENKFYNINKITNFNHDNNVTSKNESDTKMNEAFAAGTIIAVLLVLIGSGLLCLSEIGLSKFKWFTSMSNSKKLAMCMGSIAGIGIGSILISTTVGIVITNT